MEGILPSGTHDDLETESTFCSSRSQPYGSDQGGSGHKLCLSFGPTPSEMFEEQEYGGVKRALGIKKTTGACYQDVSSRRGRQI